MCTSHQPCFRYKAILRTCLDPALTFASMASWFSLYFRWIIAPRALNFPFKHTKYVSQHLLCGLSFPRYKSIFQGLPGGGRTQKPHSTCNAQQLPLFLLLHIQLICVWPVSLRCCVRYIFSRHSLTFLLCAPLWRTHTLTDKRKWSLVCTIWNTALKPNVKKQLGSSQAGKIRALSLKALYLCSLHRSLHSLNRFGVTFKSQLLRALTVNGRKGWKSKRNVSDISFYACLCAGMRAHYKF